MSNVTFDAGFENFNVPPNVSLRAELVCVIPRTVYGQATATFAPDDGINNASAVVPPGTDTRINTPFIRSLLSCMLIAYVVSVKNDWGDPDDVSGTDPIDTIRFLDASVPDRTLRNPKKRALCINATAA
jgi:hypothetical protein